MTRTLHWMLVAAMTLSLGAVACSEGDEEGTQGDGGVSVTDAWSWSSTPDRGAVYFLSGRPTGIPATRDHQSWHLIDITLTTRRPASKIMSAIGGIVSDLLPALVYAGLIMILIYGWGRWLKDIPRSIRQKLLENARRMQLEVEFRAHVPEVLALIEKDHDLTAIPKAFCWLLTSEDPALKLRTALSIPKLVSLPPITRLLKLDRLLRERTSSEWDHDWKRWDPDNLLLPSLTEPEKAIILGLASFQPNGHFREKAVRSLSRMTSGAELPYLIIRLNDGGSLFMPIWGSFGPA